MIFVFAKKEKCDRINMSRFCRVKKWSGEEKQKNAITFSLFCDRISTSKSKKCHKYICKFLKKMWSHMQSWNFFTCSWSFWLAYKYHPFDQIVGGPIPKTPDNEYDDFWDNFPLISSIFEDLKTMNHDSQLV